MRPMEPILVSSTELHRFIHDVIATFGVEPRDASTIASVLVAADLAGIDSHGVARLPFYVDRLARDQGA